MDCPRWSLEPVEEALRRLGCSKFARKGKRGKRHRSMKSHRSCDKGKLQKKVLKSLADNLDSSTTCVFEDLLDRLPPDAQKCLEKMKPDDKASTEEKCIAYNDIRDWLHDNRKWCYPPDAESYCIVHQKMCKAFPVVLLQVSHVFQCSI